MEKSRQQFEEWFKKEFELKMDEYGEAIVNLVKREQFKVWQASRECLVVELPDALNDNSDYSRGFDHAIYITNGELASNGVKIK